MWNKNKTQQIIQKYPSQNNYMNCLNMHKIVNIKYFILQYEHHNVRI